MLKSRQRELIKATIIRIVNERIRIVNESAN